MMRKWNVYAGNKNNINQSSDLSLHFLCQVFLASGKVRLLWEQNILLQMTSKPGSSLSKAPSNISFQRLNILEHALSMKKCPFTSEISYKLARNKTILFLKSQEYKAISEKQRYLLSVRVSANCQACRVVEIMLCVRGKRDQNTFHVNSSFPHSVCFLKLWKLTLPDALPSF